MVTMTLFLLILVLGGACSYLNREGPSVSCATLRDGAENACREGILARCEGGAVLYNVCEDENVCEAEWQVPGRYRCSTGELVAGAEAASGGMTSLGKGGSSSTSPGGVGGLGSPKSSGSGVGCASSSEPCPIASSPRDSIDWYTVDDTHVYFSDCSNVRRVPKAGGFAATLAAGEKNCPLLSGDVELDLTDLFFIRGAEVVRLPKTGGEFEPLGATGAPAALASDLDNVYWLDLLDEVIRTIPKRGGIEQTLASLEFASFRRLATQGGYLYWIISDGIARIATSGPFPATPAALTLGNAPDDFALTDTSIFFVAQTAGIVGSLLLMDGAWSELAASESKPERVTTDGSWIYWVSDPNGYEIRKLNLAGGAPVTVVNSRIVNGLGRIVVDATHVYWTEGKTLMRAPK